MKREMLYQLLDSTAGQNSRPMGSHGHRWLQNFHGPSEVNSVNHWNSLKPLGRSIHWCDLLQFQWHDTTGTTGTHLWKGLGTLAIQAYHDAARPKSPSQSNVAMGHYFVMRNYKTNEESEEWGFLGFTWLILSDCLAFLIISAPCSDQEPLHCLAQRPMKPYNGYYNALQTLQTLQTLQAEDLFSGNQSKTPIARNRANELPKKKLSTSSPGTWYGHGMSWL